MLGHVQGGVVPHIVQDTAGQEKPPGLGLWEVNWLLFFADGAVVGVCRPVLSSKIPHVLSAEMGVVHSPLLTTELAIAVLVPGLVQLLQQPGFVLVGLVVLRVDINVRDSLPGLASALLILHHVHCCDILGLGLVALSTPRSAAHTAHPVLEHKARLNIIGLTGRMTNIVADCYVERVAKLLFERVHVNS